MDIEQSVSQDNIIKNCNQAGELPTADVVEHANLDAISSVKSDSSLNATHAAIRRILQTVVAIDRRVTSSVLVLSVLPLAGQIIYLSTMIRYFPPKQFFVTFRLQDLYGRVDIALVLTLAVAVYFLPSFVAIARGLSAQHSILWRNFLLGWTPVGWQSMLNQAFRPDATKSGTVSAVRFGLTLSLGMTILLSVAPIAASSLLLIADIVQAFLLFHWTAVNVAFQTEHSTQSGQLRGNTATATLVTAGYYLTQPKVAAAAFAIATMLVPDMSWILVALRIEFYIVLLDILLYVTIAAWLTLEFTSNEMTTGNLNRRAAKRLVPVLPFLGATAYLFLTYNRILPLHPLLPVQQALLYAMTFAWAYLAVLFLRHHGGPVQLTADYPHISQREE